MFDAYTIKKLMPRLLIAVIGVNLSWEICMGMIDVINTIGGGVAEIINNVTPAVTDGSVPAVQSVGTTAVAGIGAYFAGAALINGGAFILVPLLLAVLSALLVGFLTLIARQMIIVVLVMIAPVAIVAWVFPGMDKWTKRWFNVFQNVLLVYPIIIGLIAVGGLLSNVFTNVGRDNDNILFQLAAVIVRFAPFFLIPFSFKFIGGLVGNLTGMVNDRSKGLFDRGSKAARERSQSSARNQRKAEKRQLGVQSRGRNAKQISAEAYDRRHERNGMVARTGIRGLVDRNRSRGYDEADIEVMKAQLAQEAVRAPSAREAQYSAQAKAGSLRMDEAYVDDQRATFRDVATGNVLNKRTALARIATGHEVEVNKNDGSANPITILGGTSQQASNDVRGAAIKLAQQGDVKGLRMAIEGVDIDGNPFTPGATAATPAQRQTITDAIQGNVGAVMGKAPDLVKPPGAAFESISAEDMITWDDTTAKKAVEHLSGMTPGTPERATAWSQFESSLNTLLNDQKRFGAQKGSVRVVLRKTLEDLAATTAAPDVTSAATRAVSASKAGDGQIEPDGTVKII